MQIVRRCHFSVHFLRETPVCLAGMQATPTPVIEFHDVAYAVAGTQVLSGFNLQVQSGETGCCWASGSGKTTSLKLVNGLLFPTTGEVRVKGVSNADADLIRLRRSIGYVIQDVGLFPHFTIERNIGLVPKIEGWPPERIRARVQEFLQLVGLEPEIASPSRRCRVCARCRSGVGRHRVATRSSATHSSSPTQRYTPPARGRRARRIRTADHLLGRGRRRDLDHGHLDELAFAGAVAMLERGDDRERGVRADHRVDDSARDDRRAAVVARDPGHAGELLHRLREPGPVAPRTGEPERGQPQHHDVGPDRANRVVARPKSSSTRGVKFSATTSHSRDELPRQLAAPLLRRGRA